MFTDDMTHPSQKKIIDEDLNNAKDIIKSTINILHKY